MMQEGGPISQDDVAERIARALDRIERASATLEARHIRLRHAARDTLAELDRLIAAASPRG